MRPSINAVVAGLPKSWHTAPSMTAICCGRGRSSMRVPRLVDDLQRVHPDVALRMPLGLLRAAGERLQLRKQLSRRRRARARARSRSTAAARAAASRFRPRRARPADRRARIDRHSSRACVVERELEPRGELDARAARAGCRRRSVAGSTTRSRRRSMSPRPSNGSRYSSVSGSQAMALTVKSRRRAASSTDIVGIAGDVEAAMAAARLRFAARQRHVDVADLVDLKALADGFDAAERFEQRSQPLGRRRRTPRGRCPSSRGPSGGRAPSRRR